MKLRRMAVGLAAALAAGLTTACAPPDPIGSVDWATGGLNSISVAGWTVDPDGGETPIALHVYVDGAFAGSGETSVQRDDVAALYPGHGNKLGYGFTVPAAPGSHRVCVYAINVNEGSINPELGCKVVSAFDNSPFGTADLIQRTPLGVTVAGWVFDRDAAGPIQVGVTVNGTEISRKTTDIERPDVQVLYPAATLSSGFNFNVFAEWTDNEVVCVTAYNQESGADTVIGCAGAGTGRAFNDTWDAEPFGNLDAAFDDIVANETGFLAVGYGVDYWNSEEGDPVGYQISYQRLDHSWGLTAMASTSAVDGSFAQQVDVPAGQYNVCLVAQDLALLTNPRTTHCSPVSVAGPV